MKRAQSSTDNYEGASNVYWDSEEEVYRPVGEKHCCGCDRPIHGDKVVIECFYCGQERHYYNCTTWLPCLRRGLPTSYQTHRGRWGWCQRCRRHRPGSWRECPNCDYWVGARCEGDECWPNPGPQEVLISGVPHQCSECYIRLQRHMRLTELPLDRDAQGHCNGVPLPYGSPNPKYFPETANTSQGLQQSMDPELSERLAPEIDMTGFRFKPVIVEEWQPHSHHVHATLKQVMELGGAETPFEQVMENVGGKMPDGFVINRRCGDSV